MSEPEVFALSLSHAHNRDFYLFYYHCRAYQLFHRSETQISLSALLTQIRQAYQHLLNYYLNALGRPPGYLSH